MQENILIVDDDKAIRDLLSTTLLRAGFGVIEAALGADAIHLIREKFPSLVLLDLGLPDMHGRDIVTVIKNDFKISHIPIIVVSGEKKLDDRLQCLESGADDYMMKPCSMKEVVARVKTVLRRLKGRANHLLANEGVRVDYERHAVLTEDKTVENLTRKEFDIFSLLVQHTPHVLSREFLAKKVWDQPEIHLSSRVIDVHISRIRQKLGEKLSERIVTVSGKGHKFV